MINRIGPTESHELGKEIEISAYVLRKYWGKIKSDVEYFAEPGNESIDFKIWVIKNLAQGLGFVKEIVTWEKKCTGHVYRYNTRPLRAHKANKLISKYIEIFKKDPAIQQNSIESEKMKVKKPNGKDKKNRYDVRIKFKHHPNFAGCFMPTIQLVEYDWVEIPYVFCKLDQYIFERVPDEFIETRNRFYSKIYEFMTQ